MDFLINFLPIILFTIFIVYLIWSYKKGKGGIFSKKMEEIIEDQHKKIMEKKSKEIKK